MSTIEKHDMTQGKILLPLVSFTIPLVLGNLFQLTYNAADSVIVGKYVGEQALAAVGTSTPIMNIAILLISGMCMGASVLMSSSTERRIMILYARQISTTMLAWLRVFRSVFTADASSGESGASAHSGAGRQPYPKLRHILGSFSWA